MNVVDKIQHYQRSLERCNNNETKTLHCIDRLYKLPVTVQHLQETGVGRTVNALRKFDGSVGDAAKALVAKWKTMVVDEESSGEDEDEACVPDASEGYSDRSNSPKFDKDNGDDRNSSKAKSNDSREKQSRSSDKHDSSRHGTKNSSSSESSKSRETDYKSAKNGTDKRHTKVEGKSSSSSNSSDATRSEKKSKSSRDTKHESSSSRYDTGKETSSSHGSSSNKSRNKTDDTRKDSSRVSSSSGSNNNSGASKNSANIHDSQRKRKLDCSPSSERETSKRRKSIESPIDEDDYDDDIHEVATQVLSRDSDDEPSKILPDTSIDSDSDDYKPMTTMKIKRETPESPPAYERGGTDLRHNVKTEKSSKSKSRESSSKSTSSASEKSRRETSDKHEKTKSSDRSTIDHRKNEKRKDDNRSPSKESSTKSRSSHSGSSSSSKDHVTSKDKDRESSRSKKESRSDSDSKDSKEKFKEPKEKKVKKKKINGDGGIDCNSGASFAEALGMCIDRPVARKKTAPLSPSSPIVKTIKTEPGTSSSSPATSSLPASSSSAKSSVKVKAEPPTNNEPQPLSLLAPNVKLEPLNVDLASTLPEISPNYKPLPSHYMNPVHRKQEEANALSQVIYAKTQRTKVYSGNKAGYTTVPSLYDMCLRVLMENIDGLGFTGGIPYDILKPVLERATADQLFTLENYNPYLIEDTDPLWEFHCNKEFRKFKREEMDSWRDTYMRCRDEREVKLRNITANIKESIDKSVPVRSAKLAYVDNVVKPPRNILRKQAKYGTAKSSTPSSDLKKKLILSGGSNSATNISVPPPPSARIKTSSSSSVVKKSKAPLMAKALQLIKGRYKR